jgi:hypothetical protein
MNPILLPKKRLSGHPVSVWITAIVLLVVGAFLIYGIVWVITSRTFTNNERLPLIMGMLIGTLLGVGVMQQLKR